MAITRLGPNQDITAAKIAGQINFKNIIINGDMSVAQRGTSTSSITSAGYHSIDRWQIYLLNLGTWTMSQETDVPTGQGFSKSLKFACTTADATPAAGDQFYVRTKFEGQNLQYLKYGTSSAESLTLSFWVKCNKTTTASVQLQDHDNSKMVTKSYTINSANTWEKKTITFNGNTSNSFTNDANLSLDVRWWLDSGSDFTSGTPSGDWEANDNTKRNNNNLSLADSTSNVWYITGVQLEADTSASDFEFLPYDVNLQRCERYCQTVSKRDSNENHICLGVQYNAATLYMSYEYRTVMRGVPSLTAFSGTSAYRFYRDNTYDQFNSFTIDSPNEYNTSFYNNGQISGTQGQAGFVRWDNTGSSSGNSIILDAEL